MYELEGFEGAKYVLTPPLRDKWHQRELWNGLRRNDLQVVSTDQCAFRFSDQKTLGRNDFSKIPNGGPGIENRLSLLYTEGVVAGLLDMNRLVELFATAPAKLFGLFPRKGTIAVGSDGDIVVLDPDKETVISARTHHMNVDYNLYEGRTVRGVPEAVVSNGEVIVLDGKFVGTPGAGRFLPRSGL
jgi:dihydropyrimidinase